MKEQDESTIELPLESEYDDSTSSAEVEESPAEEVQPEEVVAQAEEPVVEEEPRDTREYASPYQHVQPTGQLPDQLKELFDPSVYAAIERLATDIADKRIAAAQVAQSQSRLAARQIGLTDEQADHFELNRYEPMVPAEFRGTKKGAAIALGISLVEQVSAGKDVNEILGGMKPRQIAQAATRAPIAPEARMTSPRTTTAVRPQPNTSKSPFSYLEEAWGMTAEERKALQEASSGPN